jgi:hypothetical protein
MSNQENTPQAESLGHKPETSTESVSEARRRLLVKGGMAAAPVILTLTSRPVLGGLNPGECISPSQTLSGALSHKGVKVGTCSGRSPGYWKTCHSSEWPIPTNTAFHSVFAVGATAGTRFFNADGSQMTMLQVLNVGGAVDTSMVAFHCIGAYLNILKGLVDPKALTAEGIIAMWREWAMTGKYTPFAGSSSPWSGTQITDYLKNSKIAP